MNKKFIAAALAVALASPAAAATLDFTADNATVGSVFGTNGWAVMAGNGSLTNATHDNNVGCGAFACDAVGNRYDVGFGVSGGGSNNNEIDGRISGPDEFVQVTFEERLEVTAFAGMLTYDNVLPLGQGSRERVRLDYLDFGGTWRRFGFAEALAAIDQIPGGDSSFDTVGLAARGDISIFTRAVRFRAAGRGDSDDGSFNVTAAGLQVAPVPVPAALPLLLAGLGALGVAARRQKRKAA